MRVAGYCHRWKGRFRDYVLTDGSSMLMTRLSQCCCRVIRNETGRLWTYVRDDHVTPGQRWRRRCGSLYSPDRKKVSTRRPILRGSAVLQADAYAGFNELYRNGQITEAACWAHARRKIHDVHVRTRQR